MDLIHPKTVFFGIIGDRFPSRRVPFILGLILLFLSTLFLALATSLWALLTARILEGLSTAIVFTVGYTLLTEVVGMEHLGTAMGYTSMALSFGLLIGPVLGGVLYDYFGYFQVYLPAFGLIAMEVILRLMVIEKEKKPVPMTMPSTSSAEPVRKTSPANSAGEDHARNDPPTESDPLLQSTQCFKPASPYKALLTSPRFLVSLTALFILMSIANGFDSTLTPYVQDAFDMHATQAAALFLALALPTLLAPLTGWLTDRYGPPVPIIIGLTLAVPSYSLLSLISPDVASPFLKMATLLVSVGLTFALVMAPFRVEANFAVHHLEKEVLGGFGPHGILSRAIGLTNTVAACGGLVGPLYAGFLRVAVGWKAVELLNGALCAFILLLFLLSIAGRKIRKAEDGEEEV